jgi:hypothetical protein
MRSPKFAINFLRTIAFIFLLSACEQKIRTEDVPEKVKSKFETLYPAPENVQWNKEIKNYKAYFTNSGNNMAVLFDKKGHVKETEMEINEKELPETVKKTINSQYPDARLISFSRVDSPDLREYKVKMHIKTEDYKVFFSQDGELIKQVLDTKE